MCLIRLIHLTSILLLLLGVAYNQMQLPLCPINQQWFPGSLPMHCVLRPGNQYGSIQGGQAALGCPPCGCPITLRPVYCVACPACAAPCSCSQCTTSCDSNCNCKTNNTCTCNDNKNYNCSCGQMVVPAQVSPVIVMPIYTPVVHSHPPESQLQNAYQQQLTQLLQQQQSPWMANKKVLYVKREPKSYEDTRRLNNDNFHIDGSVTNYRKGQEALIPVFSYMTADGHVVYQKKLSPRRGIDFMRTHNSRSHRTLSHSEFQSEDEESENEGDESEPHVHRTHHQMEKSHLAKSAPMVRYTRRNIKGPSTLKKS